jgi:cellobiose phosphorylase
MRGGYGRRDYGYDYGYNDYGEKIGSDDSEEGKIFLNPQSWAVLAKIADQTTLERVMDSVENKLSCAYGYMQCAPSYTKGSDKLGRVSYFRPGLVENGAVYNHGVAFKIAADCMLGRGDTAYKSFKMISYDNPKNPNNGVEPYAVSNMYMGPENPHIAGYAPMSWVTGTAGWLYRCVSEYICGVKPTFKGLRIEPCLPSGWSGTKVTRKYRGETYTITFVQTGKRKLVCDGVETGVLPLSGSGAKHEVVCEY